MAVTAAVVAVTNVATPLTDAITDACSALVTNTSTVTMSLGGPTVDTATGFPLAAGASVSMDLLPGDRPYAAAGTAGPHDARVLLANQ